MDAPTEWTYGGQLDWTSADALRLAPTGMAMRCIVEDLKEKAAVTSYTLPSLLSADWNPLNIPCDFASAIQSAVTALMALFVNHTDAGGDWSGLSDANDIAPAWTEADILAALGVESRIIPQRLGLLREWVYQQYQILNLLRWVKSNSRLSVLGYYEKRGNDSWDGEGLSTYISADWTGPYGGMVMAGYYAVGAASGSDPYDPKNPAIVVRRYKTKLRYSAIERIGAGIDIYLRAYAASQGWLSGTFKAQGNNVLENFYSKAATINEMTETTDFDIINDSSVPPNDPPYDPDGSPRDKLWGWTANSYLSILKFDGANGFKFKNW